MNQLVILRTNFYSERWDHLLKGIAEDYKVIVVADTTKNKFVYDDFEMVSFNSESVNKAGLIETKDMQWRFGDYVLYLAHSAYSKYDFIWLLEPDVYINEDSLITFFEKFKQSQKDYICSYFSEAEDNWAWTKYLPELDEKKGFRTFFPLIRISRNAVDYLYSERLKHFSLANDELFVATKLGNSNFSVSTFDQESDIKYSKKYFSYRLPHYFYFVKHIKNNAIFHPVFDGFFLYLKQMYIKKSWKVIVKNALGLSNND